MLKKNNIFYFFSPTKIRFEITLKFSLNFSIIHFLFVICNLTGDNIGLDDSFIKESSKMKKWIKQRKTILIFFSDDAGMKKKTVDFIFISYYTTYTLCTLYGFFLKKCIIWTNLLKLLKLCGFPNKRLLEIMSTILLKNLYIYT